MKSIRRETALPCPARIRRETALPCPYEGMRSLFFVQTHMLHHSQLTFYEQALRPVKRENLSFVERAGEPVLENGARCEFKSYQFWLRRNDIEDTAVPFPSRD